MKYAQSFVVYFTEQQVDDLVGYGNPPGAPLVLNPGTLSLVPVTVTFDVDTERADEILNPPVPETAEEVVAAVANEFGFNVEEFEPEPDTPKWYTSMEEALRSIENEEDNE